MCCEECGWDFESDALFCSNCGRRRQAAMARSAAAAAGLSTETTVKVDAPHDKPRVECARDAVRERISVSGHEISRFVAETFLIAILLGVTLSMHWQFWMALLFPVFLGLLFPLVRWQRARMLTEALERRISAHQLRIQSKVGKFSKYFVRPLLSGNLAIWMATRRVRDPYWQGGIRVMFATYFSALMLGVLFVLGCVLIVLALATTASKIFSLTHAKAS